MFSNFFCLSLDYLRSLEMISSIIFWQRAYFTDKTMCNYGGDCVFMNEAGRNMSFFSVLLLGNHFRSFRKHSKYFHLSALWPRIPTSATSESTALLSSCIFCSMFLPSKSTERAWPFIYTSINYLLATISKQQFALNCIELNSRSLLETGP